MWKYSIELVWFGERAMWVLVIIKSSRYFSLEGWSFNFENEQSRLLKVNTLDHTTLD